MGQVIQMQNLQNFYGLRLACLTFSLFIPALTLAAPEELQVYLDEFAEPGKIGLDIHTNYVTNAEPGSVTRNMLRVTPELNFGINEHWEGALYWLTSVGPEQTDGRPVSDGYKVRLKWRPQAPSSDSPWYWAINAEVGDLAKRYYPDGTSGELKFIGVWKSGAWILGSNFNLNRPLRSDAQQGTLAELDFKVAYKLAAANDLDLQLGVEHYAGLGSVNNQYANDERVSMSFLVADFTFKGWDINVGLGTASGATQDKTLIKAIIGVPL
jgi:hypothetical protein